MSIPSGSTPSAPPSAAGLVLEVENLSVDFSLKRQTLHAVEAATFALRLGKTLCIVGESGSGKSVTAKAILNIVRPGIITEGSITLHDPKQGLASDLAKLDPDSAAIRAVRGARIAMIFQEPMSSLSPVHTIGAQIVEAIMLHQNVDRQEARQRAIAALAQVQIREPEKAVDRYPFEYSGGMRQRAMIAMALACEPEVLIADEPTTALDVTTQAGILLLLKELQKKHGMAVMFITHDLGVVAEIADEVAVMLDGRVVERGDVDTIFHAPQHPYTKKLVRASIDLEQGRVRVAPVVAAPEPRAAIAVRNLSMTFGGRRRNGGAPAGGVAALRDVSFDLREGEALGIVGESGSGKTTLGRCLMGMYRPFAGSAVYRDRAGVERDLVQPRSFRDGTVYREMRMIFQDPYSSLNPRMTVEQIIAEPMRINRVAAGSELRDRVASLLTRVGLSPDMMDRYAHAFSGGQRQRIGIARAIALDPRVIIADEATSALDGSIRRQILDLLLALQEQLKLSVILIAHDVGVIRYMCDRVAVMHVGRIVEIGNVEEVCTAPKDAYTQRLIAAVPRPDPRQRKLGVVVPGMGVSETSSEDRGR